MWRKLFKVFGSTVIKTVDMDGEVRYRFARKTKAGLIAKSIFKLDVVCNNDGTTSGCVYVSRWYEI